MTGQRISTLGLKTMAGHLNKPLLSYRLSLQHAHVVPFSCACEETAGCGSLVCVVVEATPHWMTPGLEVPSRSVRPGSGIVENGGMSTIILIGWNTGPPLFLPCPIRAGQSSTAP